jgi:hypothetical protein
MGGMEKIDKNSPKSNFHMGGMNLPPPSPFLGLRKSIRTNRGTQSTGHSVTGHSVAGHSVALGTQSQDTQLQHPFISLCFRADKLPLLRSSSWVIFLLEPILTQAYVYFFYALVAWSGLLLVSQNPGKPFLTVLNQIPYIVQRKQMRLKLNPKK